MSLGKNIVRLRNQKNMSQGDLANLLQVSRQSISKWENDLAVPELDKLMKLSEIFQVSLDDLVYEKKIQHETSIKTDAIKTDNRFKAAIIHFILAAFVILLLTVAGSLAAGILFSIPLLICGLCILIFRRHTILFTSWVLFILIDVYLKLATGVHWSVVLYTFIYEHSWNYMILFISWIVFITMIILVLSTIRTFYKHKLELNSKNISLLVLGWILYIMLQPSILHELHYFRAHYGTHIFYVLIQELRFILLCIVLTYTIRFIQTKRMNKSSNI